MDAEPANCDGCALCCLYQPVPPFTDDELGIIRKDLRAGINKYTRATWYRSGQACLWLDKEAGTCKHYEHRPAVCRKFDRGGEQCVELRVEWQTKYRREDPGPRRP